MASVAQWQSAYVPGSHYSPAMSNWFVGGEDKSYFGRASRLAGKVAGSIPAAVEHKTAVAQKPVLCRFVPRRSFVGTDAANRVS